MKKMSHFDVPVLYTTYNRLGYTRRTIEALINSDCGSIFIFDNDSTDGTKAWLKSLDHDKVFVYNSPKNVGVAGAMNTFLDITKGKEYVAKVDNDTLVPKDWLEKLLVNLVDNRADIVQAKHHLIKAVHPDGFDAWVRNMKHQENLVFNSFVGGTGIVFRRDIIDKVPRTDWMLGGWHKWQMEHPEIIKAFDLDVFVDLLDTGPLGENYNEFPEYYKETKRA